jgi:S-disulfanyl-L-cysteine oxidoreductase SoxD
MLVPARRLDELRVHRGSAWVAVMLGVAAIPNATNTAVWAEETTSSVLDGVYTDAQAARGAQGFAQYCAACHGGSLGGVGEAPGLVGAQFIADFNGLTVGDLFDRIRATMPLNNPAGLTRDQYADILAFILKFNGFPAGQKDLYRRSEFLNTIRFEAP